MQLDAEHSFSPEARAARYREHTQVDGGFAMGPGGPLASLFGKDTPYERATRWEFGGRAYDMERRAVGQSLNIKLYRYVAVLWYDGEAVEELDVDADALGAVQSYAEGYAAMDYEDGWTVKVEGPFYGMY